MDPEKLLKHNAIRQNISFQRQIIFVFKILLVLALVVIVLTSISAII